jgi:hypothetical protein
MGDGDAAVDGSALTDVLESLGAGLGCTELALGALLATSGSAPQPAKRTHPKAAVLAKQTQRANWGDRPDETHGALMIGA